MKLTSFGQNYTSGTNEKDRLSLLISLFSFFNSQLSQSEGSCFSSGLSLDTNAPDYARHLSCTFHRTFSNIYDSHHSHSRFLTGLQAWNTTLQFHFTDKVYLTSWQYYTDLGVNLHILVATLCPHFDIQYGQNFVVIVSTIRSLTHEQFYQQEVWFLSAEPAADSVFNSLFGSWWWIYSSSSQTKYTRH